MTKQITIGSKRVYDLDADPTLGGGVVAPIGSTAMWNDAGAGRFYKKIAVGDTAWEEVISAGVINFWDEAGNDLTGAGPTTPDQSLGSNNDYDVVLKRNNVESIRIASGLVSSSVPIVLPADPLTNLQASTKQYVDAGLALVNAAKKYRPWTKVFTADAAPIEAAALSASLPFADDNAPVQLVIADFAAGDYLMFAAAGLTPKFGLVYDDVGTLKVTYIGVVGPAYQDDFRTQYNLLNTSDATEGIAEFYCLEDGSLVKVADQFFASGTGVIVSSEALVNVAGTIQPTDTIAAAFGKANGSLSGKVTKGGDTDAAVLDIGTNDNFDFRLHRNNLLKLDLKASSSFLTDQLTLVNAGVDNGHGVYISDSAFLNYLQLNIQETSNNVVMSSGNRGAGQGNSPSMLIQTGDVDDGNSGSLYLKAGTSVSGTVGNMRIGPMDGITFQDNTGFIRYDNNINMLPAAGGQRYLNFFKNDFSATIGELFSDDTSNKMTLRSLADLELRTQDKIAAEGASASMLMRTGESVDGPRGDISIEGNIVYLESVSQMQEVYASKSEVMSAYWHTSVTGKTGSGTGDTNNWQKLKSYYQNVIFAAATNFSGAYSAFISNAATPDNVTMMKVKAAFSSQASNAMAMFEISVALRVTGGVATIGTIQNDYTHRDAAFAALDFTVALIDDGLGVYVLEFQSNNASAEAASFLVTYERERFIKIDNPV